VWWAIQLSLYYVFTTKVGGEKKIELVTAWQCYMQKSCLMCPVHLAMILLKDEELAR